MPLPAASAVVAAESRAPEGVQPASADAAFERVLGCVHALSACANEFWPQFPAALTEHTESLCDALDRWGEAVDAEHPEVTVLIGGDAPFWVAEYINFCTGETYAPARYWDGGGSTEDIHEAVKFATAQECQQAISRIGGPAKTVLQPREHLFVDALVPPMTQREGAILAVKVIDLLEEIDNTLAALKAIGLEQHQADLHKRIDPVWRALDPILANGPECVERMAKS